MSHSRSSAARAAWGRTRTSRTLPSLESRATPSAPSAASSQRSASVTSVRYMFLNRWVTTQKYKSRSKSCFDWIAALFFFAFFVFYFYFFFDRDFIIEKILGIYFAEHNSIICLLDMIVSVLFFYGINLNLGCNFMIRKQMWVLRPVENPTQLNVMLNHEND